MRTPRTWRIRLSTLLGLAVATALGRIAAAAATQELEELVVTARKTEESLQSAPVAVSAFAAKTIAELGLRTVDDIARYTTGLSFSRAFGRTTDRPVIRGQSNVLANIQFGVESGTAYFIDGVYFPGDIQGIDVNALERVEVIKGPQSALYGRNTYAGAINFITRPPSAGFEATAKASFAQYGDHDYSLALGGSGLGNALGARIYLRDYSYDGQYDNTLTGKTVGSESTQSAGLTLDWKPTEDFTAGANVVYRHDRDGPPALFLQGATANDCYPGYRSAAYHGVPPGSNPYQYYCGVIEPGAVALNTDPLPIAVIPGLGPLYGPLFGTGTKLRDGTAFDGVDAYETFGTLRLEWNIRGSGWTVTSLSGYRDFSSRFGTDSDHSNAFVLLPTYRPGSNPNLSGGRYGYADPGSPQEREPLLANTHRSEVVSRSTEFRIASPKERRLRGMLGYYQYDYTNDDYDLTFADPIQGPRDYTETVHDAAVFGLLSFDIVRGLTLTGEMRYMEETKTRQEYCGTNANDYNNWTGACTNLGTFRADFSQIFADAPDYYSRPLGTRLYDDDGKFAAAAPRVTLDWQWTDSTMLYAVYAQGVKPGGLNGSTGANVGKADYRQEKSNSYELGTKLTMFDRRMRLNVATYYTDATAVQFTQAVVGSAGSAITSIVTNQGRGEIYGAEIDTEAAISAALTITAGYSFAHTRITRGCDDFEYVLNSGGYVYNTSDPLAGKRCDISGNRYPLAPQETANIAFNYDAPLQRGRGVSAIGDFGLTYEGSKYVQVHNLAATGASTLVSLRAGIRSADGWSLVAFGRNLTNDDTIPMATRWFDLRTGAARTCGTYSAPCVAAGGDTGSPRAFFGALRPGRTFGVEFAYDFKL